MSGNYLEKKLAAYANSGDYAFHMPGHKRNGSSFAAQEEPDEPSMTEAFRQIAAYDITEIPGFDDLHDPKGILYEEMRRAAKFYGTKGTIFSVNGSTAAILSAISAAAPRGSRILTAVNCHRSVTHAAAVRGLPEMPLFVEPSPWKESDDPVLRRIWLRDGGRVLPEQAEEAFRLAPDLRCVVITSPTYDGIISDIGGIAEIVHAHGAVLIVDEAHGAHFSMHPYFPDSAVRLGADIVIQSLHKTLPSLTQTALLHNVTGRVREDRLMEWMDVYETSSPSYLLMASVTNCLHRLMNEGPAMFEPYVRQLKGFRSDAERWNRLRLFPSDDPSKLLIGTGMSGLHGKELAALLHKKYHIVTELARADYVLAMTGAADTEEGFGRLASALKKIDDGEA